MAVDRGGLSSSISIADKFSGVLEAFRKDIDKTVSHYKAAKGAISSSGSLFSGATSRKGSLTSEAKRLNKLATSLERAQKALESIQKGGSKGLAAATKKINDHFQKSVDVQKDLIKATRAHKTARNQLTRALEAQRAAVVSLNRSMRRLGGARVNRVQHLATAAQRSARGFRAASREASGLSNVLAGYARRIVGVLIVLQGTRRLVGFIRDTVTGTAELSSQLETSVISIAGLVAATADVRTGFGESATAADEFQASIGIAKDQVKALRLDALETSATLQELVFAFQTAIAPGVQAGLDLEQIRQFSVEISRAATAIGLQQNQLAEEIRSLFAGTITARTTRIATALGITNEDIRNAKEAGTLYEFLSEKLSAFNAAAKEAANTLSNLKLRAKDAFQLAGLEGATILIETFRRQLREVLDGISDIDRETGKITLNPDVVRLYGELFQGLNKAALAAEVFVKNLDFESVAGAIGVVGDSIAVITTLLAAAADAAIELLDAVSGLVGAFADLPAEKTIKSLSEILQLVIALTVAFKSLQFVLRSLEATAGTGLIGKLAGGLFSKLGLLGAVAGVGVGGFLLFDVIRDWFTTQKEITKETLATKETLQETVPIISTISAQLKDARKEIRDSVDAIEAMQRSLSGKTLVDDPSAAARAAQDRDILEDLAIQAENATRRAEKGFKESRDAVEQFADALISVSKAPERGLATAINQMRVLQSELFAAQRLFETADVGSEAFRFASERIQELNTRLAQLRAERARLARADPPFNTRQLEEQRELVLNLFDAVTDGDTSKLDSLRAQIEFLSQMQPSYTFALELVEQVAGAADQVGAILDNLRIELDTIGKEEAGAVLIKDIEALQKLAGKVKVLDAPGRGRLKAEVASSEARLAALDKVDTIQQQIAVRDIANIELASIRRAESINRYIKQLEDSKKVTQDLVSVWFELGDAITNLPDGIVKDNAIAALPAVEQMLLIFGRQNEELREQIALLENIDSATEQSLARQKLRNELQKKGTAGAGVASAALDIEDQFANSFAVARNLTNDLFNGVTSGLSSAIAEAFTGGDTQRALQSFATNLAKIVLDTLIKTAVANILVSVLSSAHTGGPVESLHSGGPVQGRRKPSHARARGYASGGRISASGPPPGVHPLDTTPIWAQPGEWVIPTKAVARYGSSVMEALRQGFLDPDLLRSLSGIRGFSARTPTTPSFQSGGQVSRQAAASSSFGSSPARAVVVADDRNVRRMLEGGEREMLRYFERNSTSISTYLNRGERR